MQFYTAVGAPEKLPNVGTIGARYLGRSDGPSMLHIDGAMMRLASCSWHTSTAGQTNAVTDTACRGWAGGSGAPRGADGGADGGAAAAFVPLACCLLARLPASPPLLACCLLAASLLLLVEVLVELLVEVLVKVLVKVLVGWGSMYKDAKFDNGSRGLVYIGPVSLILLFLLHRTILGERCSSRTFVAI